MFNMQQPPFFFGGGRGSVSQTDPMASYVAQTVSNCTMTDVIQRFQRKDRILFALFRTSSAYSTRYTCGPTLPTLIFSAAFRRRNCSGLQIFLILMEKTMRFFSFFAIAVIAAASLAVSGCGGTDTASNSGGSAATAESSQSSVTPVAGEMVIFEVTGMS